MEIGALEQLLSPQGWALLESLPPYDEATALALGAALRDAGYDAGLVAAALTQSRLRARAADKLGDFASGMLFTPDGLEQATRLELAARHAGRFRSAGIAHVWDLGCGIGADAMALAALGVRVTALDAHPATAAIAGVNLRHFPEATSRVGDAESTAAQVPTGDGAWFDPARRLPGVTDARGRTRRTFRLDDISPSFDTVLATAARVPATGAKLSPSLPHAAVPAGCEAQWTSYAGEVLECALWWGPLVERPGRSARVLRPASGGRAATEYVVAEADTDPAPDGGHALASGLPAPGDWLYDPDRAVLRAGLVGAVTAATGGAELAPGAGYVVAADAGGPGAAPDLGYARRYRVVEALPLQVKPLRAWLRARGVGRLVIKKRGVALDVDRLRHDLRLDGSGAELTCVLSRVGQRLAFIAVEAVTPAGASIDPPTQEDP
ncbi:MAG: methyltransferase domain-containing protein [Austwickia sp.]|nr:MAG: methyltransferase domain-containing protein [Austwickia sp.]